MNLKLPNASSFEALFKMDPETFFKEFNTYGSKSLSVLTSWCEEVKVTDEILKSYLVDCMQEQAPASFEGYNKYIEETIINQKKLSTSGKLAAAATKLLSAAGINLATTLLSSAFSSALKWLDDYIHRADRAKEALQEFDSKVDDTRDVYRSHAELVNEVSKSYDALSAKVDTSTNLNLGLSEEEYAQFISLNNELAEAFPTLVTGYDESGNAILDFGNDCDTASEKLKKLLEAERQAMNMQIASDLPQLFKDTKTAMADYEKQINQFQTEVNTLNGKATMLNDISSGNLNLFDNQKIFSANDLGAAEYSQLYDLMSSSLNDFVQTLSLAEKRNLGNLSISSADFMTSDGQSFWLNLVSLSPDQQKVLTEIIQENAAAISGTLNDELADAEYSLQTATTAKDSLWSDFTQNLVAGMNTKAGFQDLSEEGQQMAASLVQSLDSSVAQEMDAKDPYGYIRENIVSVLGNSEQDALSALSKNIGEHLKTDLSLITAEVQNTANAYSMEAIAADTATQATARLKLQQLDLTNNPVNCAQSIYYLYALAQAAGLAGQAMENISNMNRMQKTLDTMKKNGYEGTSAYLALQNRLDNLSAVTTSTTDAWTFLDKTLQDSDTDKPINDVNYLTTAQNKLADTTNTATNALQEQTDALEKEKEALEETKSEMEEYHDAVIWFYDQQIDKIDEKIEAINEENDALEAKKDQMDQILSAIEDNYDTEIQAIQDKIDALKSSNEEEEKALALEEAKRKLQEARSRKTVQVYEKGKGFVYTVDDNAIKEAEKELEKLQAEMHQDAIITELEQQIEKLEEAKEKWSEIPDAYEQAMAEISASKYFGKDWTSTTLLPSDSLLNNFHSSYTGIQSELDANKDRLEGYEAEKEAVENLKQLWDDAKNAYTYAEYEKKLETFIGSDYEYELLNNSALWREEYAAKYAEICMQIESLEEQIRQASESTSTAVSDIGIAAQTSAEQVNALNASLEAINGKETFSTHTHTNITKNITVDNDSPYYPGNPYESATEHAKDNGFAHYAKGGIITPKATGSLDYLAKHIGEDHMIAVQDGEAVIPKESVEANANLVKSLIDGNVSFDDAKLYVNYTRLLDTFKFPVPQVPLPDFSHPAHGQAAGKVVQFHGDIHIHEVQKAEELSKAIITKLPMMMLQELNKRDF